MKTSRSSIGKVVALLTAGERRRLWVVALASIVSTLVEVVGIGAIMPFITVAARPSAIHENRLLQLMFELLKFKSETAFLLFLGFSVLGLLVLTNTSQALLHYIKVKFTSMRRHSLSLRLFTAYLRQSFLYFLNKNSFDFVKNINTEIEQMINVSLMQFVEFISRTIQVTLLVLFLVLVNPGSTLAIALTIIAMYGLIYIFVKRKIKRLGTDRFQLNAERSRIVSEAFWGIKEIKIAGTETEILSEYTQPSKRLAANQTISAIMSDIPKFALETAAFSSIIVYIIAMILRSGGFNDAAGSITLFAYAGYRLIPAVQALFKAITQLKYGAATAERISQEFEGASGGNPLARKPPQRLPFTRSLELRNIRFAYPNIDDPLFSDLSLEILINSLVGFAGRTGSGKTTLVDIILGLLDIQAGSLLVDGIPLNRETIRSWQANLAYVPQNIFLSNDTIAANIAFGVNRKKIDMEAVIRASTLAQLHDFVQEELKDRYETKIGERGIRLSGGQRQRIGIARALYREPAVLIMDEATSALDVHTERAVMEAIDTLQGTRTIILIAHRLSTLRNCETIFLLEKGRMIDSGSYDELVQRNKYFAK